MERRPAVGDKHAVKLPGQAHPALFIVVPGRDGHPELPATNQPDESREFTGGTKGIGLIGRLLSTRLPPLLFEEARAHDDAHATGASAACVMLEEGRGSSGPMGGSMNASDPVYLELVDFVAGGTTPEDVIDFHPSAEAQERLAELIKRERRSQADPCRDLRIVAFSRAGAYPAHGRGEGAADSGQPLLRLAPELHSLVAERASQRCEYCRIAEDDAGFSHEVDHVVSPYGKNTSIYLMH